MNAVKAGKPQSAAVFHGQVRFKGNSDLNKMVKEGVDYIELRMLDLDPTSSVGIRTELCALFACWLATSS